MKEHRTIAVHEIKTPGQPADEKTGGQKLHGLAAAAPSTVACEEGTFP